MKVIVQFSGGKDSLASLIWAIDKYGVDKCEAVFADTGWEHNVTYNYIKEICQKLGVKLVTVKNSKFDGFLDMAIKKGGFPRANKRFCTEELKVKPMVDYVLSHKENLLIVQGIRGGESLSRSKMQKECTFFKYYLQPYTDNKMKLAKLQKMPNKTEKILKRIEELERLIAKGTLRPITFLHRKKEVLEWRKNYSDDLIRPIFDLTGEEVIENILQAGLKPNPLYYNGFERVGCGPCIMCKKQDIRSLKQFAPEILDKVREAEKQVGRSFFPPSFIPKRFHSGFDSNINKSFCTIDDVVAYTSDNKNNKVLFKEDKGERSCLSYYNICE